LHQHLKTPGDLAGQTLIHVSARASAWQDWLSQVGLQGLKARRNLSFDTVPAALEAAAQGHGVALGMDPIVWDSPAASSLVAPFPRAVPGSSSSTSCTGARTAGAAK
jgi:DNA-binding transcriptional LysR family regulator